MDGYICFGSSEVGRRARNAVVILKAPGDMLLEGSDGTALMSSSWWMPDKAQMLTLVYGPPRHFIPSMCVLTLCTIIID